MDQPVQHYWKLRLEAVQKSLQRNHFEAHVVDNIHQAGKLALEQIIPGTGARSLSWGGSMTYLATGVYQRLKDSETLQIVDTYDKNCSAEQTLELRRQALLVDLFITGTNALTEKGQLVNLDMFGNRVAALTFGPRHVLLFIGRNKIVRDIDAAIKRIKRFSAPANAMRLDKQTPCVSSGRCQECSTPDRICNTWTITEKSFPKGRIKVVLVNEDLGL
jgi:hypothetical protein